MRVSVPLVIVVVPIVIPPHHPLPFAAAVILPLASTVISALVYGHAVTPVLARVAIADHGHDAATSHVSAVI